MLLDPGFLETGIEKREREKEKKRKKEPFFYFTLFILKFLFSQKVIANSNRSFLKWKFHFPKKKKKTSNSISIFDRKKFLTDYSYRLLEDIIDLIVVQWNWKHGKKRGKNSEGKTKGWKNPRLSIFVIGRKIFFLYVQLSWRFTEEI